MEVVNNQSSFHLYPISHMKFIIVTVSHYSHYLSLLCSSCPSTNPFQCRLLTPLSRTGLNSQYS